MFRSSAGARRPSPVIIRLVHCSGSPVTASRDGPPSAAETARCLPVSAPGGAV